MSTIAAVQLPATELALSDTLEAVPDAGFEIERVVAYDPDRIMPYVWATGADLTLIEDALTADESVMDVELLAEIDDDGLYAMDWVADIQLLTHLLTEAEATIIEAYVKADQWRLRLMLPERAALSALDEFCRENDIPIDITGIHEMDADRYGRLGFTDSQREALSAALDSGYYEIPRSTNLGELANDLDISHQALSERLRRAHKILVEDAMRIGADTKTFKK